MYLCTYYINIHLPYTYSYYTLYKYIYTIYRNSGYTQKVECVADMIESWIDQLIIADLDITAKFDYTESNAKRLKYPIPPTIKWIFCQREACIIKKAEV